MEEGRQEDLIPEIELSDEDILEAMKGIPGYLDITTRDFKEVYRLAYRHAVARITGSVRAESIMTGKVLSVGRDTPLTEVARLLAESGVAGVPVLEDDGRVVGVISEKDFLSKMSSPGVKSFMGLISECLSAEGCIAVNIREQAAQDIMSSPAITVDKDTTLMEIAHIFTEKNINRVPVVDGQGKLVGLVSRADVVKARRLGRA